MEKIRMAGDKTFVINENNLHELDLLWTKT